jgi:hypothetical protein
MYHLQENKHQIINHSQNNKAYFNLISILLHVFANLYFEQSCDLSTIVALNRDNIDFFAWHLPLSCTYSKHLFS